MTDYCTKSATEQDFNTAMFVNGLIDEDGQPMSYLVLIDRIGPITMPDGTVYPEYYTNVRLLSDPTEEQDAALKAISIDPSEPQYRVFL